MISLHKQCIIGPLQDPVTWYRINYTGTQITQWDFQNKGTLTSPARLSFVWKVSLRHLRPSVIDPEKDLFAHISYGGALL